MSQGVFGLIDFERGIAEPLEIAKGMQRGLDKDKSDSNQTSFAFGTSYILGMKRLGNRTSERCGTIENKELSGLAVIHGEVANYEDCLRDLPEGIQCKGDLDLVLHLYRQYGYEFVKKLNGLFSIAIVDLQDQSCAILNDRFGMARQVYWLVTGSRLCFATHLKSLLTLPTVRREVDQEGLNLFLKYSYVVSPWSIFKGIKKLPPGHLLVFKDGAARVEPYWEFRRPDGSVLDLQEAILNYRGLLKKSIDRRLDSGANAGILLSGGLDSSANVALAAECGKGKLKTFSIGFDEPKFDERPYARIVAKHFDTQHFEYTITGEEIEDLPKLVWHLEEPYFEFGLFLTYLGLASARKEVDIVIGGEGADQLFGTGGFAKGRPTALRYLLLKSQLLGPARGVGKMLKGGYFYDHDNWAFTLRLFLNRVTDLNDWYFYGYDENELRSLYINPEMAIVPRIFSNKSSCASFPDLYLETQINQDLKHYVNENVMVKSGRMADMLGLTLREAYLDVEVADFLVSLDYSLKRSGTVFDHMKGNIKTKLLHRKAMEGILPQEIMKKPKQGGFVPVLIFLKDPDLRQQIYRYLLNSEVMKEYFRSDYLMTLFDNYERMQGREIYWYNFYNSKANRILFLLTFDVWHHFYMQNNPLDMTPPCLSDYLQR